MATRTPQLRGRSIKLPKEAATGATYWRVTVTNDNSLEQHYLSINTTEDPAAGYIHARPLVTQVSSSSSIRMASECLADCIANHKRCPKPRPNALPTRVIDCTDPGNPRLVITRDQGLSESRHLFAALSYVWGEPQEHSTKKATIDSYTRGIDINLIPQTIKDAIETAHGFGIQYLWVDALCIIQDSREDKAGEIAHMRNIFRDAYLTIIAANAQKVSEGFLQDRPNPAEYARLPFVCPDGRVGTMSLSPVWEQYNHEGEPVNSRAWCFEERLLSPRSLIYASHTLQYHCQTATVNIGDSISAPRASERLPDFMALLDTPSPTFVENDESVEHQLRNAWDDVVQDYTRRALTKPADRLLACSGLVDQFSRFWHGKYLAGLWQRTLITDLLWLKDYQTIYPRPPKYRGPSWSWAAVDGRVVLYSPDSDLDPTRVQVSEGEIIHSEVELEDERRPFGHVVGGKLSLKAILKSLVWDPTAEYPELFVGDDGGKRIPVGSAYVDSLEEDSAGAGMVYAIPLRWSRGFRNAVGLIVVPAVQGWFRRVGYFSSTVEHSPFDGMTPQHITII
ncbi:HET-domain-containing protein [Wolfiporia cocos MD-104 SS10]|uniref:HET-domain-containing protein n=1 Tax=Wolfiporia cocos (strain MD-104) TaxID=742152 RepID=A0A2H3JSW4_WOLCO|nr:HET-domain-containing protein [Wolfiporia cocos MD-104 SS10]